MTDGRMVRFLLIGLRDAPGFLELAQDPLQRGGPQLPGRDPIGALEAFDRAVVLKEPSGGARGRKPMTEHDGVGLILANFRQMKNCSSV